MDEEQFVSVIGGSSRLGCFSWVESTSTVVNESVSSKFSTKGFWVLLSKFWFPSVSFMMWFVVGLILTG